MKEILKEIEKGVINIIEHVEFLLFGTIIAIVAAFVFFGIVTRALLLFLPIMLIYLAVRTWNKYKS